MICEGPFPSLAYDILPGILKDDPAVQALSYAVRQGTRLLYRYCQRLFLYESVLLHGRFKDLHMICEGPFPSLAYKILHGCYCRIVRKISV